MLNNTIKSDRKICTTIWDFLRSWLHIIELCDQNNSRNFVVFRHSA